MLTSFMLLKLDIFVLIIAAGTSFTSSFDHVKLKFYRCFNAIYNRAKNADSELYVQLMKSFCLPVTVRY